MWNNHSIRRSRNQNVPFGQPSIMYSFPSLWNTRDYLCPVPAADIVACHSMVEFRSYQCCDPDVYRVCIDILAEDDIVPPNTIDEALRLYMHLRGRINVVDA